MEPVWSQPIRAAWIEIKVPYTSATPSGFGRSPFGLRGLKLNYRVYAGATLFSRSPFGLRGLKFSQGDDTFAETRSQPIRAAWIEIKSLLLPYTRAALVAAHSGCVD